MYQDSQLQFSASQALTATATSTNYVDLQQFRALGIGEPMEVVIVVPVALAGTSPTFQATLQADTTSAFGAAVNICSTQSYSALAAGTRLALPVPADKSATRFLRINYTLGGTSPTVTVTAELQPQNMLQNDAVYPKGYTVT